VSETAFGVVAGAGAGVGAGGPDAGIVGVGVDAVDVDRFAQVLERRPNIAVRMFSPAERAVAEDAANRAEMLAARFAAKEALMKSIGVGIGAFPFCDVEVQRSTGTDSTRNAPYFVLHGRAAEVATARGAAGFHLSMSHTDDLALAFVVAVAVTSESSSPPTSPTPAARSIES
jgi:phosphopantetheine--protein transferase-like protein